MTVPEARSRSWPAITFADHEVAQELPDIRQDVLRPEYLAKLSVLIAFRVEQRFPQFVIALVQRIGRISVQAVLEQIDHIRVKAIGPCGEASLFVGEIGRKDR